MKDLISLGAVVLAIVCIHATRKPAHPVKEILPSQKEKPVKQPEHQKLSLHQPKPYVRLVHR